jgi:hypothetical protein
MSQFTRAKAGKSVGKEDRGPTIPFDFHKHSKQQRLQQRRAINKFIDATLDDAGSVSALASEMKRQGIDSESQAF